MSSQCSTEARPSGTCFSRASRSTSSISKERRTWRNCRPITDTKNPMRLERLNRITINDAQCGGRPCIRGMRIRVSDILELLGAGASFEEILEDYPYLEREDIL